MARRRPTKAQRVAAAARRQRRIPPPGSLARVNAERIAAAQQAGGSEFPFSIEDIAAQAAAMSRSQIASQEASLQGQLGQLGSQGERLSNVASGAYAGLGRLLSGIGPQIAGVYNQAAEGQMQAGQGFSDAFQAQAQADAAADAAFLSQQGAPQAQQDQLTQAPFGADVLYGTGGYIPSSSMGREGAAWGAYGATLPAASARMGQMEIADILRANAESAGPIRAELASLQASLPGLQAQIQNDLFGQRLDAWQAQDQSKLNWAAFNLSKQELGAKTASERRTLAANATQQEFENLVDAGYDPFTGKKLPPEAQAVSVSASEQAGIWTDKFGNPILFNGKTRKWKKDGGGSGRGGTPEVRKAKNDARAEVSEYVQQQIAIASGQSSDTEKVKAPGKGKPVEETRVNSLNLSEKWYLKTNGQWTKDRSDPDLVFEPNWIDQPIKPKTYRQMLVEVRSRVNALLNRYGVRRAEQARIIRELLANYPR